LNLTNNLRLLLTNMSANLSNAENAEKKPETKTRLAPKARELLTERANGLPVWIRAPKFGTEHFTGFSRAKLYELAGKNLIRSVSIREPGAIKGTRLFHLQSILDYIEKCEAEAAAVSVETVPA
jgi:hypothetical protein